MERALEVVLPAVTVVCLSGWLIPSTGYPSDAFSDPVGGILTAAFPASPSPERRDS